MMPRLAKCVVAAALWSALANLASASIEPLEPPAILLADGNSSVSIRPAGAGMSQWSVDGTNQLHSQQYWFRIGNTGGERPLSSLTVASANQPAPNRLNVVYHEVGAFRLEIDYMLTGGPTLSGYASIGVQLKVDNLTADSLDFHLIQYADFDLGGAPGGDLLFLNESLLGTFGAAYQSKGNYYFADQLMSPGAQSGAVDVLGVGGELLAELSDGSPTTVNGPSLGSGDVAWGFQWDAAMPAFSSFTLASSMSSYVNPTGVPPVIDEDLADAKYGSTPGGDDPAVPEPSALIIHSTLLGLLAALYGLGPRRLRR